jgi:hypothetical protein
MAALVAGGLGRGMGGLWVGAVKQRDGGAIRQGRMRLGCHLANKKAAQATVRLR